MGKLISLHPFNFVLIMLVAISGLFISNNLNSYLLITAWAMLILWLTQHRLKWKAMFIFILLLIPAIASFYLSSSLFANTQVATSSVNSHLKFSLRLFSLALISYSYTLHLPKEKFILNLLQRRFISVNIGFALLAVFNAFEYLGHEFYKIQLAYQMRFGKKCYSPKIMLPLLVSAARYANTLTISMYARGINQNRTYHTKIQCYTIVDTLIVAINMLVMLGLVYLFKS